MKVIISGVAAGIAAAALVSSRRPRTPTPDRP